MAKRRASSSLPRPSVLDIATSPMYASQLTFPESSLRSTLRSNAASTLPPGATVNARPTTRSQSNLNPSATPFLPTSRGTKANPIPQRSRRHAPPERDDTVYMMNQASGSVCRPLDEADELPQQALIAIQHLKRAQELAELNRTLAITAAEHHFPCSPAERVKWHEDLLQRNLVARIKQKLRQGALLVLEKSSWTRTGSQKICEHPFCAKPTAQYPTLFFVLQHPPHMQQQLFCLTCLESLWNGYKMQGRLPNPDVFDFNIPEIAPTPAAGLTLDGIRESLDSVSDISCPTLLGACSTPDTPRTDLSAFSSPQISSLSPKTFNALVYQQGLTCDGDVAEDPAYVQLPARPQTRQSRIRASHTRKTPREAVHQAATHAGSITKNGKKCKETSMKTVFEAEERLDKLYHVRDELAESIEPGESINVVLRKTSRTDTPRIHADALGIIYTDLLSQPLQRSKESSKLSTTALALEGPRHRLAWKKQHGCICRGLYTPGAVLWCKTEKCLIGWYHIDCVENWAETDDDWLCPQCTEHTHPSTPASLFTPSDVDNWFAPPYAQSPSPTFDYVFSPFDGPDDSDVFIESLMQSKHAVRKEDMQRSSWSTAAERSESPMSWSDQKVCQPTSIRFQHLARFIRPGDSLGDIIKATVNLWRLAAQQQLAWEAHAQRTLYNRSFDASDPASYAPLPGSRNIPDDSELVDVDDEAALVAKCGVAIEECESTALSTPLDLMYDRYKERSQVNPDTSARAASVNTS